MRTQISDAVADAILVRLPGKRGCSRADLEQGNGPAGVLHFLHQSLERRAQLEVAERFDGDFGWFDVSQSAVQAALQYLQQEVATAARFPHDEWERAVRHACTTTLEYLIDPVETLMAFAFPDDVPDVAAADLRRRAGYFSDYSYMATAVDAYLSRKADRRVARSELGSMIRHVVHQLTSDYTSDDWLRLLQPLLSFIAFSERFKGGLPVTCAEDFFDAHGQAGIRAAVRKAARAAGADMISTETLGNIVRKAMDAPLPTEPVAKDDDDDNDDDTPEPLWKQFSSPNTSPTPATQEDNQPLWKSFQDRLGPDAKAVTFADMERSVLDRIAPDRDAHVNRLFSGDATAYADVIRRLYHSPDWTTASGILANDVFRRFSIDIYSDEAVAFTNAVESRYS